MLANTEKISQVQHVTITENQAGQRVDNFLFTFLNGVPKSRIYRLIRSGELRINRGRVKVHYRLVIGDLVRIPPLRQTQTDVNPSEPKTRFVQLVEKAICYEDQQLIIINKPAGLAVHGGSGIAWGLIEILRHLRPQAPFLELVHRLDRETSGCIMIAKKRSLLTSLHEALQSGKIEKKYLCVVEGRWSGGKLVDAPLLKYALQSGERVVKVDPSGKVAQTAFKIIKSGTDASLLQATLLTGRTHQIRVHCAFMGHPIVGDQKYGKGKQPELLLHAHQLNITLPYEPFNLSITCPMPKTMETYCEAFNLREDKHD